MSDPGCVKTALVQNRWTDSGEVDGMGAEDAKELLIEKLSNHLHPTKHSRSDLSFRFISELLTLL